MQEFLRHESSSFGDALSSCWVSARNEKHVVEGLLLALADIDHIIQIIRKSRTQAEAKEKLMGVECPAIHDGSERSDPWLQRFPIGARCQRCLHPHSVQTDAILRMTLGQLAGLEQERNWLRAFVSPR